MTTPDALDLATLAMDDPAFRRDPLPFFAAARAVHPWLARCPFGLVVHDYMAMRDLLGRDDHLRTAHDGVVALMGAEGSPWGRFMEEQILGRSGLDHKRLRDLLAGRFTPRQADANRALMRAVIARLLDEWAPRGAFDFEAFASHFPITVLCAMIGAPAEEVGRVRASLEALGLAMSLDAAHLPAMQAAMATLDAFVADLLARRRAEEGERRGDMLDQLLDAQAEGGLSERELWDLLIFLFVAGYDTSKNVLTLMMHTIGPRPDIYARCAEDAAYCRRVVEEALRYHNPATIPRLVTDDLDYRGVTLPAGTMLFFPVSIAGRDPGAVAEPDRFDPERRHDNRHLAFGRGAHICMGQFIARAQIEEGWHLIAQRLRNPRVGAPDGWRPFFGVWGIAGLPIRFDPAPADVAAPHLLPA